MSRFFLEESKAETASRRMKRPAAHLTYPLCEAMMAINWNIAIAACH